MRLNQIPLPPGTFLAKQYADALIDNLRYRFKPARSFSQHGEDGIICECLKPMLATGFYVDVGANHPSKLSNTFKLYKQGMRGIAVEPNPLMCRVYQQFRPEDICVNAGLGASEDLQCLNIMKYHGLSSFSSIPLVSSSISDRRYTPITTLKRILERVNVPGRPYFALLSLDCEGWDEMILQGNDWTAHRPRYVITEFESEGNRDSIASLMSEQRYVLEQVVGCNLLFRDRSWVCENQLQA